MSFDTFFYLALFAGAFFVMTRFGCGAHAFGHSHHRGGQPRGDSTPAAMARSEVEPLADGQATDPVCGMIVDKATALSTIHDGKTYRFCSQPCRDKFLAAPALYALSNASAPKPTHHHHGCC